MEEGSRVIVGIDTGGTFTDLVAVSLGSQPEIYALKVPSNREAPSTSLVAALKKLTEESGVNKRDISYITHGTTIVTNALLEGRGSKIGMITNQGFRDVLEIGRQARGTPHEAGDADALYNPNFKRRDPVIPRKLRLGVRGRVSADGKIVEALDRQGVHAAARQLSDLGCSGIIVCFLNSYKNAAQELEARDEILAECPDMRVYASAEVLPEFREYERYSTVALNAIVASILESYLRTASDSLRNDLDVRAPLFVMQANGVVVPTGKASERAISTVQSGVVGGALGARNVADSAELSNVFTMDIGGTSTDISHVENGLVQATYEGNIAGSPIRFPRLDVESIGAGGGSIAWLDNGGLMRVGPQSAGSSPGPAAYAQGGDLPTLTDAHVVLNRIGDRAVLGGSIVVDRNAAVAAVSKHLAAPLRISVEEAAAGIVRVANAAMLRGLRRMSVERGHDPRESGLVVLGGAGPLHGVDVAAELGIPKVVIPLMSGVLSALGTLSTGIGFDAVETCLCSLSEENSAEVEAALKRVTASVQEQLTGTASNVTGEISISQSLDIRYKGQGYEITVPAHYHAREGRLALDALHTDFDREHNRLYGHSAPGHAVEVVNARAEGQVALAHQLTGDDLKVWASSRPDGTTPQPRESRRVAFGSKGRAVRTNVYAWEELPTGYRSSGPTIIEHAGTTAVIPPEHLWQVDNARNLVVEAISTSESSGGAKHG